MKTITLATCPIDVDVLQNLFYVRGDTVDIKKYQDYNIRFSSEGARDKMREIRNLLLDLESVKNRGKKISVSVKEMIDEYDSEPKAKRAKILIVESDSDDDDDMSIEVKLEKTPKEIIFENADRLKRLALEKGEELIDLIKESNETFELRGVYKKDTEVHPSFKFEFDNNGQFQLTTKMRCDATKRYIPESYDYPYFNLQRIRDIESFFELVFKRKRATGPGQPLRIDIM